MADVIIVDRLVAVYDPIHAIMGECSFAAFAALVKEAKPRSFVNNLDRDDEYHPARVKDMVNRMRTGWVPDPIELDCTCSGGRVLDEVELLDGHHRVIASMFYPKDTITAHYGGTVDLLEWLRGDTDTHPSMGDVWWES